jgi:hypothetical protein
MLRTLPNVYEEMPFEFQPEDGFIKKPKLVSDLVIIKVCYTENLYTFY